MKVIMDLNHDTITLEAETEEDEIALKSFAFMGEGSGTYETLPLRDTRALSLNEIQPFLLDPFTGTKPNRIYILLHPNLPKEKFVPLAEDSSLKG